MYPGMECYYPPYTPWLVPPWTTWDVFEVATAVLVGATIVALVLITGSRR